MPTAWPGLLGLRGSSPRQQGPAHTNPKRERGTTDIERGRSRTASTATYHPAVAAPTAIRDALALTVFGLLAMVP